MPRFSRAAVTLFLFFCLTPLFADEPKPSVATSVVLLGTPWQPTFSTLVADVPLAAVTSEPWLAGFSVHSWYLAMSAYFVPTGFYELGSELVWGLGPPAAPGFEWGLGTAFSQAAGVTSIPFITHLGWNLYFGPVTVTPVLMTLIYGNGFIAEADLKGRVSLGPRLPFLLLGGHSSAAVAQFGETYQIGGQYGFSYGLGWAW